MASYAVNAMSVQIHFSTISGGVVHQRGFRPLRRTVWEVTWNTIEDSRINSWSGITNYNGFWQGFFRNTVNGSVNYNNNTLVDPDGNEVQTNTIHGNLNCSGNESGAAAGRFKRSPNVVTGQETGQCVGV